MRSFGKLALAGLAFASVLHFDQALSQTVESDLAPIVVPATAGKVDGLTQNSDQFIWNNFVNIVKPVAGHPGLVDFQTWASDEDIYTSLPAWPIPEQAALLHNNIGARGQLHGVSTFDVTCVPAGNPYVAKFPLDGCITEEVRRNRPEFDYIVQNGLYDAEGLAAFYASSRQVNFPKRSLSIKVDWVPVATIMKWVPELTSPGEVRRHYYTAVSDRVEYGLVAMHLVSKWNPAWVWGTFEHEFNPGRCDATGCYDSFGAIDAKVMPNYKRANTQYGECRKSTELKALMTSAGIDKVWSNYCLKSTQTTFVSDSGKPTILANSVTERLSVNGELIGSCITCHAYASFGNAGTTTKSGTTMLDYNPVGKVFPSALKGTKSYDFMWGVLNVK